MWSDGSVHSASSGSAAHLYYGHVDASVALPSRSLSLSLSSTWAEILGLAISWRLCLDHVGSFLLKAELLCLQWCLGVFLLTVGAFLVTIGAFLVTIRAFSLTVEAFSTYSGKVPRMNT